MSCDHGPKKLGDKQLIYSLSSSSDFPLLSCVLVLSKKKVKFVDISPSPWGKYEHLLVAGIVSFGEMNRQV